MELIHFEKNGHSIFGSCVKEEQNQWRVVSSVARISPKERIVSNLAQGGEQKRPFDVLSVLYMMRNLPNSM
ncbi:hypothetical protein KHA80_04995 [Anaerobacillus sp. HL2]|nr:hypothetical protein KHA80_04995 [Anaerobacillus sp. HL2]